MVRFCLLRVYVDRAVRFLKNRSLCLLPLPAAHLSWPIARVIVIFAKVSKSDAIGS